MDQQNSKRVPEKHLPLLYWLCQRLWLSGSQQTVKYSLGDGNTRPSDLPLEKPVCRARSNGTGCGTMNCLQSGKGVYQSCILSPCLFNLLCRVHYVKFGLGESQAGIQIAKSHQQPQICRWYWYNGRKWRGTKESLDEGKEESEKVGLKSSIQKTKIVASCFMTPWQIDGETMEQWQTLFSWTPKSLQMVTAVMKLKDPCCLEGTP